MSSHESELEIGGLVPLTTTDLPGYLSAVVFCQGCPWQCRYCHNAHLIPRVAEKPIRWTEVLSFLDRRKGLLDAVVFSGGEPTMQPALLPSIRTVVGKGFKAALHTAGQYPRKLREIAPLLSWIGMDVKAPPSKLSSVIGRPANRAAIAESIETILEAGIDYEFRTTIHSMLLSEEDIREISSMLCELGVKRYVLQCFRPLGCRDEELSRNPRTTPLSENLLLHLKESFEHFELRSHENYSKSDEGSSRGGIT